MKLCLVGKYPPIEGGVSASHYWIARGLASRGHEVHVVTNAAEVEPDYRMEFVPEDRAWYQPVFPRTGGSVRVHGIQPFDERAMRHIPQTDPVVSRLAGLTARTVRAFGCDAVLSYYYEPYAVAAAMAAGWTGRPLAVKHAGSDLDRLCRVPDLAAAYREVLRSADMVLTRPALMPRFLAMGVDPRRLRDDVPFPVPTEVFHPGTAAAALPTIGIYGKTGAAKGTYDLIAALGTLAREGHEFRLLAMIGGPQGRRLRAALEAAGIAGRTEILPLVPHWRVPDFLRSCTAVCFLERDFPIAIHGPVVPREVVACGVCLILSGEIAARQGDAVPFESGENVLIVPDPRVEADLVDALRVVVTRPDRARELGMRGHRELFRTEAEPDGYAWDWERICEDLVAGTTGPAAVTAGDLIAPGLMTVLHKTLPSLSDDAEPDRHPVDGALDLCDRAAQRAGGLSGDEPAKLRAALDYQRARLTAGGADLRPAFAVSDAGPAADISSQRPVASATMTIRHFPYDVTPLFTRGHDEPPAGLEDISAEALTVLFDRSPNGCPVELRVTETVRDLVTLADGTRTVDDLTGAVADRLGVARREAGTAVAGTLRRLHQAGVLVFAADAP